MTDVRTLILDIETSPTTAYVWQMFDNNLGLHQLIEPGGIMCWSAKWAGDEYIYYSGLNMASREEMALGIWEMLDEADEVVGWNSNSFDLKLINAMFLELGMGPPSPYKKVDLMRTVKSQMKFLSNKLDYISGRLDVGHKTEHNGFTTWVECLEGKRAAWALMREYNENDVLLTESMYEKLRGWITSGVNRSTISGDFVCHNCGSSHLQKRGTAITTTMLYQRYQCMDCGAWPRSRIAEKADRSQQLVRAV